MFVLIFIDSIGFGNSIKIMLCIKSYIIIRHTQETWSPEGKCKFTAKLQRLNSILIFF